MDLNMNLLTYNLTTMKKKLINGLYLLSFYGAVALLFLALLSLETIINLILF